MASSAIRAFISALKLRRCLDFIFARFPRQRFYTLMSGPNFGEHFTIQAVGQRFERLPLLFANPYSCLDFLRPAWFAAYHNLLVVEG